MLPLADCCSGVEPCEKSLASLAVMGDKPKAPLPPALPRLPGLLNFDSREGLRCSEPEKRLVGEAASSSASALTSTFRFSTIA